MKKKILAILLTSVMCFSTAVPVFANTEVTTLDNIENQFLDEILRYVPCTGGGANMKCMDEVLVRDIKALLVVNIPCCLRVD